MSRRQYVLLVMLAVLLLAAGPARAQVSQDTTRTLVVGTKEAPPFAIKEDGAWRGISIDLWRRIADELNLTFAWRETDLQGLLRGVEAGSLDVAVAALTITAEREERLDFTHPFYVSGLGIAVPADQEGGWLSTLGRFLSLDFLKVVGILIVLLLVVGLAVWGVERKRNPEHFGGGVARGIASGFWWSAVTMTTVGYGDKAPKTLAGRLLGLIWMFTAVIIISSFTAAIASSLTASQFSTLVQGPDDLSGVRVGTVPTSTSASYLNERRIAAQTYGALPEALRALEAGELDALVYDAPILRYLVNNEFNATLNVLPGTFETQYYGLALPENSTLRDPVNQVLLEQIRQPAWKDVLYLYLGD